MLGFSLTSRTNDRSDSGSRSVDNRGRLLKILPQQIKEIPRKYYVRQDSTEKRDYVWLFRDLFENLP